MFHSLEEVRHPFDARKGEVRQLFRQAGMHIVNDSKAENGFEHCRNKYGLLVCMNVIIFVAGQKENCLKEYKNIE